tara:strand:+ start:279 stop:1055 length:777 start_codon:yes stop_codon:yes gene_type:complete
MPIPHVVFIVPYRNREEQKYFFATYMSNIILADVNYSYEIYFSHQNDTRPFNRGAVKNIGFQAVAKKYPNHYRDIIFIFNDIDTVPFKPELLNFNNVPHGTVRHFYGFKYALGGIVAFRGGDFEATNGYPNLWGWGMEDCILQKRCESINLSIDRSVFFPIRNPNIFQLFDGVTRNTNAEEASTALYAPESLKRNGLRSIRNLKYNIKPDDTNYRKNIHSNIFMIDINSFQADTDPSGMNFFEYNLKNPVRDILNHSK